MVITNALLEAVRDALTTRIADLRCELAQAEDSLIKAIQDRDAYRAIAKAAVHRLAELATQNDRLRARHLQRAAEEREHRQEAA